MRCSDPSGCAGSATRGPPSRSTPGATAMDNLQLAGAIQNYLTARDLREGGVTPTQNSPGLGAYYAGQYWKGQPIQSIYALSRGRTARSRAACNKKLNGGQPHERHLRRRTRPPPCKFFMQGMNNQDMGVVADLLSPDYQFNGAAAAWRATRGGSPRCTSNGRDCSSPSRRSWPRITRWPSAGG